MDQLHIINSNNNAKLLDDIYRLRHDSFNSRLGWEVRSFNEREIDRFDSQETRYIALTDTESSLIGCWRALPTQGDYMLRSVFPELLQGEALPQQKDVWEISRFTVNKQKGKGSESLVGISTAKLVKSFYEFALSNNISSYVAVTTVACERLLKRLGITMRRLGRGEALQIGIEKTVALEIEVDEKLDVQWAC